MYEERFYRAVTRPPDLLCYEVKLKETDLFCCTKTDLTPLIEERILHYRYQLEEYIRQKPVFLESLAPVERDPFAPAIAKAMIEASTTIGVGPMACVAGAIAEFVGRDIASLSDEFIIENGGDISMKTRRERTVVVYAKDSPYSGRIGIRAKPREEAFGLCTSSATVGPSLSLGRADAVCVLGSSALFVDGVATLVGNRVKKEDDIEAALEAGRQFSEVTGMLIIMKSRMGAWGDIDLVKVQQDSSLGHG
jgi:uncharacterized protein